MNVRRILTLVVFFAVVSASVWGATITIAPAPGALPNGVISGAYSQQLTGTGGSGSITWSVSAGSLPPGINLVAAPGGEFLSGTFTQAGTFSFTISASTATPDSGSQAYTINVLGIITPTPLPGGIIGAPYSVTLTGTGIVGTANWALVSSSLPPGLTLGGTNGATIQGIPTAVGTTNFTVSLTDGGDELTTTSQMSITVARASVTPTTIPGGSVGNAPYSVTFATSPAISGLTWTIVQGGPPTGLSLSSAGVLSGQLNGTGTFQFTVQAASGTSVIATQSYTVTVTTGTSALPSITTLSFNAPVGSAFSAQLLGTGGTTCNPGYTFGLNSTSGAANTFAISSAGVITGTPTVAGSTTLNVMITDCSFVRNSSVGAVVITVGGNGGLTITTTSPVTPGVINAAYTTTLSASGGTAPYTWSASGLPSGLTIAPSTGVISGTPTSAGTTTFTATVADSASPQNSATASLQLVVSSCTSVCITSTSPLPAGVVNTAYTTTLQAVGGSSPYSWSVSGSTLPPGLTLNASTGVISGTPTTASGSPFTFNITVNDSASPAHTATSAFSISVTGGNAVTVTTASPLPSGTVGVSYLRTLTASGGTAPYTWSATGLPAGLTLSSGGVLSGTPTAAGSSTISVTVTDSATPTAGTGTATLVLTINTTPLSITTTSLPAGPVGFPYSKTLQAAGGTTPYTWTLSPGSPPLPAGLALSAGGILSGTPTAAGSTTFSVTVTDSSSPASTAVANLTSVITTPTLTVIGVNANCFVATANRQFPDPQVTPPPSCPTNNVYQFTASGSASSTPNYVFTVAVPSALPPGLTLSSNGILSGTPTAAGSYTFTVVATDSLAAQGAATATIVVTVGSQPSAVSLSLGGTTGPSIGANLQPSVVLSLGNTFPFPINGKVTVGFVSSVGGINTLVTFAGGQTATFRIPAGSQTATVGQITTGTQAGTITLTATQFTDDFGNNITPGSPATVSYTVAAAPPVITSIAVSAATPTGFTLAVTGYSTTRDMTSATFTFTSPATDSLASATVTVPLTSAFTAWYGNPQSNAFGSAFVLTIPFTVASSGSTVAKPVSGVTVTATNSKGTSTPTTSINPYP